MITLHAIHGSQVFHVASRDPKGGPLCGRGKDSAVVPVLVPGGDDARRAFTEKRSRRACASCAKLLRVELTAAESDAYAYAQVLSGMVAFPDEPRRAAGMPAVVDDTTELRPEFPAGLSLRNPQTGATFEVIEHTHAVRLRNLRTDAMSAIPQEMAREFERVDPHAEYDLGKTALTVPAGRGRFYVVSTDGGRLTDRHDLLGPYGSADMAGNIAARYRAEGIGCEVIESHTRPVPLDEDTDPRERDARVREAAASGRDAAGDPVDDLLREIEATPVNTDGSVTLPGLGGSPDGPAALPRRDEVVEAPVADVEHAHLLALTWNMLVDLAGTYGETPQSLGERAVSEPWKGLETMTHTPDGFLLTDLGWAGHRRREIEAAWNEAIREDDRRTTDTLTAKGLIFGAVLPSPGTEGDRRYPVKLVPRTPDDDTPWVGVNDDASMIGLDAADIEAGVYVTRFAHHEIEPCATAEQAVHAHLPHSFAELDGKLNAQQRTMIDGVTAVAVHGEARWIAAENLANVGSLAELVSLGLAYRSNHSTHGHHYLTQRGLNLAAYRRLFALDRPQPVPMPAAVDSATLATAAEAWRAAVAVAIEQGSDVGEWEWELRNVIDVLRAAGWTVTPPTS